MPVGEGVVEVVRPRVSFKNVRLCEERSNLTQIASAADEHPKLRNDGYMSP